VLIYSSVNVVTLRVFRKRVLKIARRFCFKIWGFSKIPAGSAWAWENVLWMLSWWDNNHNAQKCYQTRNTAGQWKHTKSPFESPQVANGPLTLLALYTYYGSLGEWHVCFLIFIIGWNLMKCILSAVYQLLILSIRPLMTRLVDWKRSRTTAIGWKRTPILAPLTQCRAQQATGADQFRINECMATLRDGSDCTVRYTTDHAISMHQDNPRPGGSRTIQNH